jgi:hypothetical protein
MARPGLEPGTPRFSVVRANLSNRAEIPGKQRVRWSVAKRAISCYLRSFALRLGTEVGSGTQCSQASAPDPRVRQLTSYSLEAEPRVWLERPTVPVTA